MTPSLDRPSPSLASPSATKAFPGPPAVIRAVFFDLGGTLIDQRDYLHWSEVAAGCGLAFDADALGHAFEEVERETDTEEAVGLTEFWRRTLERASQASVSRETAERFVAALPPSEVPTRLFSDARRCLDELQDEGKRLGIISNSRSEASVRELLRKVRVDHYFSYVTSSGTEGVAKPSKEIFDRALTKARVAAHESFYVGNLAFTDAEAARRAGLFSVWLNRSGTAFNFDPPEVTTLLEVPNWVRRLEGRPELVPRRRA